MVPSEPCPCNPTPFSGKQPAAAQQNTRCYNPGLALGKIKIAFNTTKPIAGLLGVYIISKVRFLLFLKTHSFPKASNPQSILYVKIASSLC